jgi:putative hydrolase of the HAD superfamily
LIDALMIDVDGVLVNGRPDDGRHWASNLLDDLGLDPAVLQQHFFARHWSDVIVGKADLFDLLAPVLAEIAPHLSAHDLATYWFAQDAMLDQCLLDELQQQRKAGRMIALATNQEHRRVRYLLETLGLQNHIDHIYYSAAMGVRKPDASFFQQVEREGGLSAGRIVLVDDTAANVEAAARAGWRAIHWAGSRSLSAELSCLYGSAPGK